MSNKKSNILFNAFTKVPSPVNPSKVHSQQASLLYSKLIKSHISFHAKSREKKGSLTSLKKFQQKIGD